MLPYFLPTCTKTDMVIHNVATKWVEDSSENQLCDTEAFTTEIPKAI